MAVIAYTYNLDSKTWTNPGGAPGTSFLPSLTFGEKPTLEITLSGTLPQGLTSVTSWSCAIAKDWLKSTSPMARTTEDIEVSDNVFYIPLDTCTDRFLAVVDGQGNGVPCWMQITGYDASHTPTVEITLPLLCNPALDPAGAGTIPPIRTTELSADQIQAMIDKSIASAIAAAQADATTPFTALSGTSGAVSPGGIYTLAMTEDFTLSAATETDYGEAVVFAAPGEYTFSVADGITLDADMSSGNRYRLLVSWTPWGVHVEQTAEWEVS